MFVGNPYLVKYALRKSSMLVLSWTVSICKSLIPILAHVSLDINQDLEQLETWMSLEIPTNTNRQVDIISSFKGETVGII